MDTLLHGANDFALELADSPWVFVVVLAFAAIDAIFPVIPSESVVVALAAISAGAGNGQPDLLLLGLAGGVGALLGDNATFLIGRRLGIDRFGWMRRPRMQRAFHKARLELDKRAALMILTARYIPVGRVAVNLTAGATGFPYRRFFPLSIIAATSWAIYAIVIGVLAGTWVEDNPMLGVIIAVSVAVVLGLLVDRGLAAWRARRGQAEPGTEASLRES